MPSYDAAIDRLPSELSLGATTIRIARSSDLARLQVGYSVDPQGGSLTGDGDGDWRPHWVVIGIDDTCGDPIFIDSAQQGFPVYTAIHGQGDWERTKIGSTIEGFESALNALVTISRGRDNPLTLASVPITPTERLALLQEISIHNADANMSFWEALIDAS